jgi:predicted phosphodiesterase
MVESISLTTNPPFPLSELDDLVDEITASSSIESNGENWIFIGDSHSNKDYLGLVRKKVLEENVDTVFHLGDFGSNIQDFLEEFRDFKVFLIKGNHDKKSEIKKTVKKYENAEWIDDKIIDYNGWKIVGKGLPEHMVTNFSYKKKFKKLLEEALEYENVIVLSHGGSYDGSRWPGRGHKECIDEFTEKYEDRYGHQPLIIHAHKHKSLLRDMYDPPVIGKLFRKWLGRSGNFDIHEFYNEFEIESPKKKQYNVALKTGVFRVPRISEKSVYFELGNNAFEKALTEYLPLIGLRH